MSYWCEKCSHYFLLPYYCIHFYHPWAPNLLEGMKMRLYCATCQKSVSNELPDDTVVRALLVCPECIEKGKIIIPEEK